MCSFFFLKGGLGGQTTKLFPLVKLLLFCFGFLSVFFFLLYGGACRGRAVLRLSTRETMWGVGLLACVLPFPFSSLPIFFLFERVSHTHER